MNSKFDDQVEKWAGQPWSDDPPSLIGIYYAKTREGEMEMVRLDRNAAGELYISWSTGSELLGEFVRWCGPVPVPGTVPPGVRKAPDTRDGA